MVAACVVPRLSLQLGQTQTQEARTYSHIHPAQKKQIILYLYFWIYHCAIFLVSKTGTFGNSDHFWTKKWHFEWQNQNSKTTFIVQTFPKYCRIGFHFIKLSLLSPILAKFQFCWFSGLFWAFFPCKKCKNENLSLNVNFWSITLKFFLWTPTTHEHEWLKGLSSIQKKCKNGTP